MIEREYTIHGLCKKLIGNTVPIGDSGYDQKCYDNLPELLNLYEKLTNQLITISNCEKSDLESVKRCGEKAKEVLEIVFDEIQDAIL